MDKWILKCKPLSFDFVNVNVNVYLYTAHITHHVSWRFTILLSEIGRQLVKAPLAAAISPF